MKRLTLVLAFALAPAAPYAMAQPEPAEKPAAEAEEGEEGSLKVWEWLNFALLAGGLTWIFRKNGVPYFASRAIAIRKEMAGAGEVRAAAERRMAEVEARLAALPADIAALQQEALAEQQAEHERMRQQIAAELAKIRAHAEQEIASAAKAARLELKRHVVELAIGMAEQKIRVRMNSAAEDTLLRAFIQNLERETGAQAARIR